MCVPSRRTPDGLHAGGRKYRQPIRIAVARTCRGHEWAGTRGTRAAQLFHRKGSSNHPALIGCRSNEAAEIAVERDQFAAFTAAIFERGWLKGRKFLCPSSDCHNDSVVKARSVKQGDKRVF